VKPDVVDAVVMGSRIFEKNHLRKSVPSVIQEIGKKSEGIGVLRLTIQKDKVPQNGLSVSVRKEGKILGSDITTDEGDVSFRLAHGKYECIVMDRAQNLTTFFVKFDESTSKIVLDLNVKPLLEI
ncbi:MAG: hypothetical protein LUQ54_01125, partial [Methanoregula sp.]|nr:hypothetical protein [Methanoregula sp.]